MTRFSATRSGSAFRTVPTSARDTDIRATPSTVTTSSLNPSTGAGPYVTGPYTLATLGRRACRNRSNLCLSPSESALKMGAPRSRRNPTWNHSGVLLFSGGEKPGSFVTP